MSTWSAEDSAHLKASRENAGIDAYSFARSASISLAQLHDLEGSAPSEDQLFYSESIKRHVGRSLLTRLGVEPLLRIQPSPPEPTPVEAAVVTPNRVQANTKEDAEPKLASKPIHWADRLFENLPWGATTQGRVGWSVVLAATVAAGLMWAEIQAPSQTARVVPLVAKEVPVPAPVLPPSSLPEPAASEPTASIATATAPAVDTPVSIEDASLCDWKFKDKSLAVVPNAPLKAGNYVHLVADKNTTACVLDSQKKRTQITLKAGEKLSVFGSAPFLVYSPEFSTGRMFFQGKRIDIPDPKTTHVTLNEAKSIP